MDVALSEVGLERGDVTQKPDSTDSTLISALRPQTAASVSPPVKRKAKVKPTSQAALRAVTNHMDPRGGLAHPRNESACWGL